MLQEIAEKVCKINNKSKTLCWGSHSDGDCLVLVCGHPSIKILQRRTVYFLIHNHDPMLSICAEVGNKAYKYIEVVGVDSAVDFVIMILKEVYGA